MRYYYIVFATLICFCTYSQNAWKSTSLKSTSVMFENKKGISKPQLYSLDISQLKANLVGVPKRFATSNISTTIISFPDVMGKSIPYRIQEMNNMDPALAIRYPDIKSYVGESLDGLGSKIYFSISPLGFQSMTINIDRTAIFIEPYTTDLSTYVLFEKQDKAASLNTFECKVLDIAEATLASNSSTARPNADDSTMRTFRLAMSVTGEYTAYFGGTKALALAAINNTMTRVNAVFENDFTATMVLIANTDAVIYTNATTDPYSAAASMSSWNAQLQATLTSVIGEANYDIGHLFGASGGGGNAGCIGCVCVNGSKGSGITSPADGIPQGDNFDIDYVAHEMGHQFGGNHTFSHNNEATGVNVEPGSGSTIMGYAGITAQDVQMHSDPFFHAASIQQITNNIKAKTCPVSTSTGNAVPTANAGLDYTIPKSTPFMLTGSGTDANGDLITYCWEQMDSAASTATGVSSAASATRTSGPTFRSYNPSTSPVRYFPIMNSVLTGATTTAGTDITVEALSSVARTLNFRLTVRDNHTGGPANNSDDALITVNATAGPFTVSSPNTAVTYAGGSSQTITWAVAGTTANGVNCANVDILLSTDGGSTWSTLLAATPNDGTDSVTIPNASSSTCRIMVKGTNHIFFDVSNTNFTITSSGADTTAPSAPTLLATGTTSTTTNLSWSGASDNFAVTGYDVYKDGVLLGSTTSATTYSVTGLTASTTYVFTVKAKDAAGNISVSSNSVSVTTVTPDFTVPTAPTLSASGTTPTTTNLSWTGATDNIAVTGYDVYKDGVLLGSTTSATTYAVSGLTPSTTYAFTVKAKDAAANVSVASNTVNVTTMAPDTSAPSTPTLSASGTTSTTTNLSWTTATDNVGVTAYDVYKDGVLLGSTTTATTYAVSGLVASTSYVFTVKAKDASGNVSLSSNSVTVTTLTFTYCTSLGNSVADELIGRVQMGTIDNSSTGGTGYTDFTSLSTNATQGSIQTIIITPTWTATNYSEGYAVFIDYNADGDFADTGETVWTKAASTTTPVTGTFTVPATATPGPTRMRVSLKYNAIPTSCETFSYGQVEDYTVVILAADTTAPSVPTISASGTSQRTTNLSWTTATDNIAVTGYDVYKDGVLLGSTTSATTYSVTGLTYATTYVFTVKAKDAAGNTSAASTGLNVTTLTPPTTTATACGSYTWSVNNQVYTTTGLYTGINSVGDTEFLNVTITPNSSSSLTASACGAYTWSANNVTYTSSGDYTNVVGCTTTTLHLTITPNTSSSLTVSACGAYTWSANNVTYTSSGDYTNVVGCVTTTLHLTITPNTSSSLSVSACGSYTWSANNVTYTTSGDYTNVIGCATTTLHLTITPNTSSSLSVSACVSYTWSANNVTYTTSGDYTNVVGCATTTLHLTITPNTSSSLTVSSCGSYTWPANNVTYTSSGNYTNIVGCATTTLHLTITSCTTVVNVKLQLQGYYDTDSHVMKAVTLNQGTGTSSTDVDMVTLELRNTSNTLIGSSIGMLQTNGTLVCNYGSIPTGSYYLVVKHRNTIETWSASTISIGLIPATYDFTTASNKAYGNNMKQLEAGVYGMYTGDINQEGNIDNIDYSMWEQDANNLEYGNFATDLDGDGNVNNIDYSIWELNSNNLIYTLTPFN
jgi:chitodextrinase